MLKYSLPKNVETVFLTVPVSNRMVIVALRLYYTEKPLKLYPLVVTDTSPLSFLACQMFGHDPLFLTSRHKW